MDYIGLHGTHKTHDILLGHKSPDLSPFSLVDSAWKMKKLEITVFALKLRFKALNQKVYSKNQIIDSL